MKGRHHIVLETKHLKYEFDICRNITVINGDSATGKTTLVSLLQEYGLRQDSSGIRLQSDVPCVVFSGSSDNWKYMLDGYKGSIVFFDEGYDFVFSKEFSEAISHTDNYYVIIARKPLKNLPYSTKEIYGIRTSGKYHFPEQVYHEFYPMIEGSVFDGGVEADREYILLVEDEKSGYQFFSSVTDICEGVGGNAKFYNVIQKTGREKNICIIADGAAFGAYISDNLELRKRGYGLSVYLPESFEWLILKSGVVVGDDIQSVLAHPEMFIDSEDYFTWERFFTDYLKKVTEDDTVKKYSKSRLAEYYKTRQVSDKVVSILPNELKKWL
ncbi:MAG: translation initiation factor 2 [Lachnospiraceae bacterium]|nr:translation initiation factor 2 [Lachnospiraceae bacterium]